MSTPYNTVLLIGRVGNAPEVTVLRDGKSTKKAKFSLCERKMSQSSPDRWHTIIAYGSRAETVEKFVTKGRSLALRCTLTYNKWTDNNNVKHERTELVLEDPPGFLDSLKSAGRPHGQDAETGPTDHPDAPPPGSDSDLSFMD